MHNGNYYTSDYNAQNAPSPLNVAGAQNSVEDELGRILREYRDAKLRYDNACINAQMSNTERMAAADCLNKISDVLQKTVEVGRFDKTQPQPIIEAKTPYPR